MAKQTGSNSRKCSILCLIGALCLLFLPLACNKPNVWKNVPGGSMKVLVSFPPLYCFAKNILGDEAKVVSLLTTQGPHDYQATANDSILAREANIFFYNGLSLDDFVTRIANAAGNSKLVLDPVADALPKKLLLKMAADHDHGHAHDHGDEHGHHHHGEYDPHVWLGIPQAIQMVEQISTKLQAVDPKNKETYAARAKDYISEIEKLQEYGKKKLEGKKNRQLVTMHESLAYFANSFDLEIVGSIQLRPNVEPDQRSTAELVDLCKKKDVRVIAIEPQYRPGSAEALKRELARQGVKVELIHIDPIETADSNNLNANLYVNVMKQNIDNLAKALP